MLFFGAVLSLFCFLFLKVGDLLIVCHHETSLILKVGRQFITDLQLVDFQLSAVAFAKSVLFYFLDLYQRSQPPTLNFNSLQFILPNE